MDKDSVVEIVIRLDEAVPGKHCTQLMEVLAGFNGIISVFFPPGREYLAVVKYDTSVVHASDILGKVADTGRQAHLLWSC